MRLSFLNRISSRHGRVTAALVFWCGLLTLTACSKHSARDGQRSNDPAHGTAGPDDGKQGSNIIPIDGSSTVFPITEAVAEEFQKGNDARVTIGVSGTGGGFKKLCAGEVAITGASRPIRPSEVELCAAQHIDYIELPVAYDGLSIVVHPDNNFAQEMKVEELKKLWEPAAQGKITKWSQVRGGWPDKEIHLFGPGVDSGTYDYFTAAIVGREHESRGDFTSSEDDNVLVQGVSTDKWALGFFGFAYYSENAKKIKLVGVDDGKPDNGAGAIQPSVQTVADGTYQPLSRPVFIYINKNDARRAEVAAFVDYYLTKSTPLVVEVGYIPLSQKALALVTQRFAQRTTGSLFAGKGSTVGATVEKLLEGI